MDPKDEEDKEEEFMRCPDTETGDRGRERDLIESLSRSQKKKASKREEECASARCHSRRRSMAASTIVAGIFNHACVHTSHHNGESSD